MVFRVGESDVPVELADIKLSSLPDGAPIEPHLRKSYYVSYRFNELGCRGRDYPIPRRNSTYRILLLGDSVTLGAGVYEEDTFAHQLERLLNEQVETQSSGNIYEVINRGVSGYATREERLFYELFASRYEPDIVLLVMVGNDDISWTDKVKIGYVKRRPGKLEHLLSSWHRIQKHRYKLPFPDFSGNLEEIIQLRNNVQEQGARLAVVIFNHRVGKDWTQLINTVTKGLQGTDIPLLVLGDAFRKYSHEDLVVHERLDNHPNEIAHGIAAQQIKGFLQNKDLLGPR